MVIAIDGPAGAGKSTVARLLARRLGLTYLDSGAMYRCVALAALEQGASLADGAGLGELAHGLEITFGRAGHGDGDAEGVAAPEAPARVIADGRDVTVEIRSAEVSAAASEVSAHAPVREAMVAQQRRLIATGGYVAEGRDIGTVVSPDSPLKVFLTADEEERAQRRASETGESAERVLAAQRERDGRDRDREHGALRPAADAVEIDTTGVSIDTVVERLATLAEERGLA